MVYQVIWSPTARRKLARELPEKVAAAVWEFAVGPLANNPQRVGRPLRRELTGSWSARRGEYRVIYRIDDTTVEILIVTIDHRRDVYRHT